MTSSIVQKQHDFLLAVGKLLAFAETYCHEHGYFMTLGDGYRDPRVFMGMGSKGGYGSAYSVHKMRLAIDINLIDGKYLAASAAYKPLHDFWDTIGGAARIEADLNHFSFQHGSYR